jgi:1-pyrroline-5-carboxylate dehydrogenase
MNLTEFRNEPYTDFSVPSNRSAMESALAKVRSQFGKEYPLHIAGEQVRTGDLLTSVNPSDPTQVVGVHHKATPELADRAVEEAYASFDKWANTAWKIRIDLLRRVAARLRERKPEFNAWLVFEAGKSWIEAEADTSEAIDFCEYYALLAERLAGPQPIAQLPGERNEMVYVPLGVGVVIPPWNFPLAILAGMTVAALVTGNTVVLKPSSETPTIAAKFVEVLFECGLPARVLSLVTGSGSKIGDRLVLHPKTRFIAFTGSREIGLRINELAAKPQKGQIWIKRVIAEMGGKDAILVDADADLSKAVDGVVASAFGYQGQKCSACSRAIVDAKVYDEFLAQLQAKVRGVNVGPADDPSYYMGPVISASAEKSILNYIEVGKGEGTLLTGGGKASDKGYYIEPTVIAGIPPGARIFQEEIFGPVLAVTKADNFGQAMDYVNQSEYGLTGAIYSNNPAHVEEARKRFFVGNLYVNRKCTGAMVGAHPFGGFNMSGTDSKAGGPDYLLLFVQAKSIAEKIA